MEGLGGSQIDRTLELLTQLDQLKLSDPQNYAETVNSLGITDSNSLKQLEESLLQLRKSSKLADCSTSSLQLPNGSSFGKEGLENRVKSKEIAPVPGFVIKTRMSEIKNGEVSSTKVFINVCSHPDVTSPSVKKKFDERGEPVEGLNIPISVGSPRGGTDKEGSSCVIVDVVVHTDVVAAAAEDITGKYRDFVCQISLQSVEQKHFMSTSSSRGLDKRYKLPKLKYMGAKVEPQLIQDRSNMPTIEELTPSTPIKSNAAQIQKVVVAEPKSTADVDLEHKLLWVSQASALDSDYLQTNGVKPVDIQLNEYIDPIHDPPVDAIIFIADLVASQVDLAFVVVKVSVFKLQVI